MLTSVEYVSNMQKEAKTVDKKQNWESCRFQSNVDIAKRFSQKIYS